MTIHPILFATAAAVLANVTPPALAQHRSPAQPQPAASKVAQKPGARPRDAERHERATRTEHKEHKEEGDERDQN